MRHNLNNINMNNQLYQQSVKINTPYSSLGMANTIQGSGDMGKLIPILAREILPGQTFNLNQQVAVQFMPFVSNLFHEINGEIMTYVVPYRLLWDKWEDFITGGEDGQNDDEIPSINLKELYEENDNTLIGTLADAFGMPTSGFSDTITYSPNCWPWRAYNYIYNEAYRYIDIEDPIDLDQNEIQIGHWNNDRFTRARIFQQRGIVPTIPVSNELQELVHKITSTTLRPEPGYREIWENGRKLYDLHGAELLADSENANSPLIETSQLKDQRTVTVSKGGDNGEFLIGNTAEASGYLYGSPSVVKIANHSIDDLNLGMNLNDLLIGMGILKYEVHNAKLKPRYGEQIEARFGVFPEDARLQRPEYLGTKYFSISVDTVTQTSADTETSKQGNITGQAWGSGSDINFTYKAKEHCILMSIMMIKPKSVYEGGLDRQWMKKTRFDYATPELYNMPDVPIYKGELKYTGDEETDKDIFGWSAIYDEYRVMSNMVTGLLRPSEQANLKSYTLARYFEEAPSLNADFVKCVPDKNRIVQYTTEPTFIYFVRNDLGNAIPLPMQNEPADGI